MSVLLDALKKAALEKKKRDDLTHPDHSENSNSGRESDKSAESSFSVVSPSNYFDPIDETAEFDNELLTLDVDFDDVAAANSSDLIAPEQPGVPFEIPTEDHKFESNVEVEKASESSTQIEKEIVASNGVNGELKAIEREVILDQNPPIIRPGVKVFRENSNFAVEHGEEDPYKSAEKNLSQREPNNIGELNEEQKTAERKQSFNQLLRKNQKLAKTLRQRFLVQLSISIIIAIIAISVYYFYVQSGSTSTLGSMQPLNTQEIVGAEEFVPSVAPQESELPLSVSGGKPDSVVGIITNPESAASELNAEPAVAKDISSTRVVPTKTLRAKDKTQEDLPKSLSLNPPMTTPVKNRKQVETTTDLDENLRLAYQAFHRGDLVSAQTQYQAALELDPLNRDGLLGVAAIALAQNRSQDALAYYQKVLARNPADEYANGGIFAIAGAEKATPELVSKVNLLLLEYPQSAQLHFLKGALDAKLFHWYAAQKSFFSAWSLDSQRGDYAYNLAVALDHIHQPVEALRFYKKALELQISTPIPINSVAILKRISQLESGQ